MFPPSPLAAAELTPSTPPIVDPFKGLTFLITQPDLPGPTEGKSWCLAACDAPFPSCSSYPFPSDDQLAVYSDPSCDPVDAPDSNKWRAVRRVTDPKNAQPGNWYQVVNVGTGQCLTVNVTAPKISEW